MCHSARKQLRIPRRHVFGFWDTQCKFQNVAGQARTWAIVAALQTKGNSITMETAASMIGMLHKATPSMYARRQTLANAQRQRHLEPVARGQRITKRCPRGGAWVETRPIRTMAASKRVGLRRR
ncbi:hypothetical protein FALCPG4_004327 [Fusarium falciforme]